MSKEEYPYPDDEFDALGASRVPQGVHREPAPRWRQWLPYVLVLILVPLITFGAVKFFAGGSDTTPEPTASDSVAPVDSDDEEEDVEADESDEASTSDEGEENADEATPGTEGDDAESDDPDEEDPDEPAELDHNAHILILNGARVQGLAGKVSDALAADGWLNTEADNYDNAAPTVTTLYYTSEAFEAEAQEIAQQLGIETIVEDAAAASDGIVIVLRTDFSLPDGN